MFGAAIFLTGLVGIGVPVAIHLLARQRTRNLAWGAMAFLQQSISSNSSKRNRLKDLLLLLLRALAILFLILTFAQPLASRLLVGGSDLETILIWDISLSTSAIDATGKPLQESLKESLLDELADLPDRSQVRILLAGAKIRWLKDEPLTLTKLNRRSLETAIRKQGVDQSGSEIATAILIAITDEKSANPKQRNILVFHDSSREGWQQDDSNRWQSIHRQFAGDRNLSLRVVEPKVQITTEFPQLSVDSLKSDREISAPNTPVRFQATLKNHSGISDILTTVIWRIDGREISRSPDVKVLAGEELKLEQFLTFETSGCHQVECESELQNDPLPADNTRTAVISIPEGIPVLIVDDTVKTQSGQILPTEFISASLGSLVKSSDKKRDPKSAAPRKSLYTPRVVKSDEVNESIIDGNLAVVIANATNLKDSAAPALRDFVEAGGGLWIIMSSDQQETPAWTSSLLKELGLESLSETRHIIAKDSEHLMKIVPSDPSGAFADGMAAKRLDLHRAEFLAVHSLQQRAFLNEEKLLETEDGVPVLLSLSVEAGHVMLQTTDLSRVNTNLPVLQSFVPFVRETMMEAIRGALPRRNLEPGEPIRLPISGLTNLDNQPRIKRPDASMQEMSQKGNCYEISETLNPGSYQLEQADSDKTPEIFAVHRPATESVLDPISSDEITALIKSPDDLPAAASEEARRGRWPLAWLFAILTGFFFLAEALLAHWMARRRELNHAAIDLKPVF